LAWLGTAHTSNPALEDGTDTGFRNVGLPKFEAREIPKRTHTIFKTWRKFEIKYTTEIFMFTVITPSAVLK
jgi:hypothetical protein